MAEARIEEAAPEVVEKKPKPEETLASPPAVVIALPEPFRPVNGYAKAVTKRGQDRPEQLRLF